MPPLETQHGILASHLSKVASSRIFKWEREHANICYRGKTLGHGKILSPYTQRLRLVGTAKPSSGSGGVHADLAQGIQGGHSRFTRLAWEI